MIDLKNLPSIENMTPDEKDAFQAELDAALALRGKELEASMKAAEAAATNYDNELKAWQERPTIKALAEAKSTTAKDRDELKADLQNAAILRQKLTGEKTWKAFQCAVSWTPKYDESALLVWALNHAPGEVRSQLISLNKTAANNLIKSRADEQGIIKGYEGAAAIPAMVEQTYTGKILADKLTTLEAPKPIVAATSDVATISVVPNHEALLTAPSITKWDAIAEAAKAVVPPIIPTDDFNEQEIERDDNYPPLNQSEIVELINDDKPPMNDSWVPDSHFQPTQPSSDDIDIPF